MRPDRIPTPAISARLILRFIRPSERRPFQAPSLPGDAVLPRSSPVNHVGNDDEECSRPVEITQTQSPLFS